MSFQNLEPPGCQHEHPRGHPRDTEMKRRTEGSSSEAALEGRLSQRAARDVLQDLNGIPALCAESNHAVDCIKYSSHQATPKDRLHVCKSLLLSRNSCAIHFF